LHARPAVLLIRPCPALAAPIVGRLTTTWGNI
jgi:hypothetical protein